MSQEIRKDWFGITDVRNGYAAVVCAALCAAFLMIGAIPDAANSVVPGYVVTTLAMFPALFAMVFAFGLFAVIPGMAAVGSAFLLGPELVKVILAP